MTPEEELQDALRNQARNRPIILLVPTDANHESGRQDSAPSRPAVTLSGSRGLIPFSAGLVAPIWPEWQM
jgi:hypothetical protein